MAGSDKIVALPTKVDVLFLRVLLGERPQQRQLEPLPLQGLDGQQQPGKKQCQANERPGQQPAKEPAKHRSQKPQQHEQDDRSPKQDALKGVETNKFALLKLLQEEENEGWKKRKIGQCADPAVVPIHRRGRRNGRSFGSLLFDVRLFRRKEIPLAHRPSARWTELRDIRHGSAAVSAGNWHRHIEVTSKSYTNQITDVTGTIDRLRVDWVWPLSE